MKKPFLILAWVAITALPQSGFSQISSLQAFLNGQKTKYSTEGHPKAKGLNISIEYPSHWKKSEGERPNIVQKFTSDASDGLLRMCTIGIKDQPSSMKLFSEAMFTQETLKEMVAFDKGATFIKGEQTKYDGQPGAWVVYMTRSERAGLRAEIYVLQHMFLYSGKLIVLDCSVGGLAGSTPAVEQEFTRYLPLFQLIGNSIVIQDKWKKTSETTDTLSEVYGIYGVYGIIITMIISFILTWGIGLTPPLLIRFAFLRRPISKGWAIGTVGLFLFINIVLFTAMGSKSKTHAALFFVAWASYAILRKGAKKQKGEIPPSISDENT